MTRPLSGIRVLELGNLLAGPFCGMLLGDMGADVIKIEPRRFGDMIRNTSPHLQGESANYIAINRNKRSIAIDLKQAAGRDIVLRLAEASDLVLENFRPGVMEQLGLGSVTFAPSIQRLSMSPSPVLAKPVRSATAPRSTWSSRLRPDRCL